ncbi:protein DA1-related 5-like [Cicer arietinum]|uniref:protein DA1-related 5-like n=1 Tax=Cicer arietinum TaxID=3827 RepID=UPI003CC51334
MDLLSGGAVGAVMGEIVKHAIQTIKKGRDFGPTLEMNIETLNTLAPLVEEMKRYSDLLDRSRDEIERLEKHITEGQELVTKSKKLNRWKFPSFPRYQSKLQKKDEALQRHLSVNVQVENRRDLMEVLGKVNGILEILMRKENLGQFNNNNIGNQIKGLNGAPEEPECLGMVEPLNKLKIELLKDGVSVLVLTSLGGSGKSTLAKKICWDPQIKGKFDGNIFYVTVSKTPNLNNIVKTLFEHCGSQVPEFQSDEDAIKQLRHLLRKVGRNPILLVLDDVWPRSEGLVKKFKFQMSEEDLKGKKFVEEESQSEEDEHLCEIDEEEDEHRNQVWPQKDGNHGKVRLHEDKLST